MEPNNTDRIERYLDGLLSEEQQKEFERAVAQDEQLREEVSLHQTIRQSVGEEGALFDAELLEGIDWETGDVELKERLRQQGERLKGGTDAKPLAKTSTSGRVITMRGILAVAASVLLLLTIGGSWWVNANYSNDALAETYYETPDMPGTLGNASVISDALTDVLKLVQAGNFKEAQTALEAYGSDQPDYLISRYYLGDAYFQQDNFAAAMALYTQVLEAPELPNFINRDRLQWNLALSKLGAGEQDAEFDRLLEDLAENGTPYFQEKAQDLQARLNSFWNKISF